MSIATDVDRRAAAELVRVAERDAKWLPRDPVPLLVHRIAYALAGQRDRARYEAQQPIYDLIQELEGEDPQVSTWHIARRLREALGEEL